MAQSHIGKNCPYCQFPIKHDSAIMICPACKTPHHWECWQDNDGCTTFACSGEARTLNGSDLEIDLSDNFDDKEWLIMCEGAMKGPFSRRELIAPAFLKPADMLWNNYTQQWIRAEDLSGYRPGMSELFEYPLVDGKKQPALKQQPKKSIFGLASVFTGGACAVGSYLIFNDQDLLSIFNPIIFLIIGLIALVLGIAGLVRKEKDRKLPAVGSVFSLLLIISLIQSGLFSTPAHSITMPETPTGPNSGLIDTEYRYSVTALSCAAGCNVEYCFDWGDGNDFNCSEKITLAYLWLEPGSYQIRVKARCAENPEIESSWSSPLIVTIGDPPIAVPPIPELISPADKSIVTWSIHFHWQPVEGAENYKLYLIRVSDGKVIIDQELGAVDSYDGSSFLESLLESSFEYKWRVSAGNSAGWSEWSTYWSFTYSNWWRQFFEE